MKRRAYLFTLMSCILLLAACGIDNTMYNARKYFRTAQERPLNANGKPGNQSVADYTKTIQKCGVILTERKDSAEADDALFLMAKALYFKGNSAFQAKDQFTNLIKAFPNSPFVPEAYIYLAKVDREINRPKEAKVQLEEFIRNHLYRKDHPKALLILADFEIKDKDFVRAQYWLEKIISEYPKTQQFAEAYFLFGKNYYQQKDYTRSLQQFKALVEARRIGRDLKMDADYYIGLNLYYLQDYEAGNKILKRLINNEYRTDRIAPARVLRAQYLLALNKAKDAEAELDYIVKTFPRTAASAEAQYIKAQYQYYQQGFATEAIASYNRVRNEFNTSEFADIAQRKATALTHINQKNVLDCERNLQQFTDYQFLAADYFVDPLNLPDSALVRYSTVLNQKLVLAARYDSLLATVEQIDHDLDSLKTMKELVLKVDSLASSIDSTDIAVFHTTPEIDSSDIVEPNTDAPMDSLSVSENTADSLHIDTAEQIANLDKEIAQLHSDSETAKTRITGLESTLLRFQTELVPFCYFAQGSVLKNKLSNTVAVDSLYALMQREYPDDKYTISLNQMRNGAPIRLIDRMRERSEAKLDQALGYADTMPDSMLVLLHELTDDIAFDTGFKADFRLGWYYTFEAPDTLLAKEYFDKVLASNNSGDYGVVLRRFYNGKKFLFNNSPLTLDSLAVSDSLVIDSLAVEDSLSTSEGRTAEPLDSIIPDSESGEIDHNPPPSSPTDLKDAIKEEDIIPE